MKHGRSAVGLGDHNNTHSVHVFGAIYFVLYVMAIVIQKAWVEVMCASMMAVITTCYVVWTWYFVFNFFCTVHSAHTSFPPSPVSSVRSLERSNTSSQRRFVPLSRQSSRDGIDDLEPSKSLSVSTRVKRRLTQIVFWNVVLTGTCIFMAWTNSTFIIHFHCGWSLPPLTSILDGCILNNIYSKCLLAVTLFVFFPHLGTCGSGRKSDVSSPPPQPPEPLPVAKQQMKANGPPPLGLAKGSGAQHVPAPPPFVFKNNGGRTMPAGAVAIHTRRRETPPQTPPQPQPQPQALSDSASFIRYSNGGQNRAIPDRPDQDAHDSSSNSFVIVACRQTLRSMRRSSADSIAMQDTGRKSSDHYRNSPSQQYVRNVDSIYIDPNRDAEMDPERHMVIYNETSPPGPLPNSDEWSSAHRYTNSMPF